MIIPSTLFSPARGVGGVSLKLVPHKSKKGLDARLLVTQKNVCFCIRTSADNSSIQTALRELNQGMQSYPNTVPISLDVAP